MIEVRLLGLIQRPGLKQVDESITFKQLLEEHGGGKAIRRFLLEAGAFPQELIHA